MIALERHDLIVFLALTFGVAFAFCALFTALAIGLCHRFGLMDRPCAEKTHARPTPRLGGPALWLALMFALAMSPTAWPQHVAILMGSVLVLLVGVVDDVRGVHAVVKLLCLAAATAIMCTRGVTANLFGNVWLDYLVTLVWTLGVVSAINALDNMDGLAGGVSFVAACMFLAVALQTGQDTFAVISAALMGVVLGFLAFNRPPAQVFLGDSGAFLLGYVLAATSVLGAWSTHPIKACLVPVFILSVPLADLGFVLLARWVQGRTSGIVHAITYRGHDHLSHRLVAAGFSRKEAVLIVVGLAAATGALAVAMRNSRPAEAIILAAQLCLTGTLFFLLLAKAARRPA